MCTFATSENSELVQARQKPLRATGKTWGNEEDGGANPIQPQGQAPEADLKYVRQLRDVNIMRHSRHSCQTVRNRQA